MAKPADASLPLAEVRVLDLAGSPGAYGARLLADLGADVLKVEPPSGDPMRAKPPFRDGVDSVEASLLFATYHANKRGITLDVASRTSVPLLEEMSATADVVMVSPSDRTPLAGFDRDTGRLEWAREDAVVCAITPFGLTGPYRDLRATPFISYAMGGQMHRVGPPEGPPIAIPGQQLWDEAGIHAALATVAALRARADVGGQTLDLAIHEVSATKDFLLERYHVQGLGTWGRVAGVGIPPSGTWECADGPLDVAAHQPHHWDAFLEMLDHPDELSESSLADPMVRQAIFDGLEKIIAELVSGRSRLELFDRGQRAGLPCNPNNRVADFVADAQPRARGLFVETARHEMRGVEIPWLQIHTEPPLVSLRRPAPTLGQHNRQVYVDELGHGDDELASWKDAGLV